MAELRFHHIGVVTADMEVSLAFYKSLGYVPSAVYEDPIEKAKIVLLNSEDAPAVELIAPMEPASPAAGWVKRINAGPYHICYEVKNIESVVEKLKLHNIIRISDICPAVAFKMRKVVFLWGRGCGLLELLEA